MTARPERSSFAATASGQNIGGAERDRTADPLLAKQVLSQLSYSPNHRKHPTVSRQDQQTKLKFPSPASREQMVGPGRLELPTPRLSSVCSNQLSYGPISPLSAQTWTMPHSNDKHTTIPSVLANLSCPYEQGGQKHLRSSGPSQVIRRRSMRHQMVRYLFEERET